MNEGLRAHRIGVLMMALVLLGVAQAASAAAGKVLFVSGPVTVERGGGAVLALAAGDAIEVGDVIVTGEQARAQLLMGDAARIALRAGTRFRVDAFSLPANVQAPEQVTAVAASGRSVATLLKGGFRTRSGTIGKADPAAYEMRTPVGTLGIRGTDYTAVFCRGDCADAPGLPPGQPIPDGLYLAVDEGTIVFNGRGLTLSLTAPRFEFIPLETGEPRQLAEPPAFLRGDGAGALAIAGRTQKVLPGNAQLAGINERRSPTAVQGGLGSDGTGSGTVVLPITATSPLGLPVDLTGGVLPPPQQNDLALAAPSAGTQAGFSAGSTPVATSLAFDAAGNLTQFPAPFGTGGAAVPATYSMGSASNVDTGSAANGIRWGRWSGGNATAATALGTTTLVLTSSSLHWILGPVFEVAPILPVTGTMGFALAGGTTPSDTLGNLGTLGGAYLTADFTNRSVAATLSLDLNGINWFASGSAPIAGSSPRFSGTFTTVLTDGHVPGAGTFTGFFTAPALTPDQLSGAGVSYSLTESLNQLGTVSGVAAFVPGAGVAPVPLVTQRALAYGLGSVANAGPMGESAIDPVTQLATDANGNLTHFVGPYRAGQLDTTATATTATYDIGTAATVDTGFDTATGLRWGRWSGGTATITLANNTNASESLASQSLPWIVGSAFGASPALPQSGTANFQLVGGTSPTDTLGNVGTLGNASLSADFTNHTVTGAVLLTVDGRTWYGAGAGTFAAGSLQFAGSLSNAAVQNLAPANGAYSGFFTPTGYGSAATAGAGVQYSLTDPQGGLGTVSGVVALAENAGAAPVAPPALAARDVGYIADQELVGAGPSSSSNTPSQFALDAQLNLIQFHETVTPLTAGPYGATFDIGTSSVTDTGYDSIAMLRWGRWSGGVATMTPDGGTPTNLLLTQQSIHWIMSGDAASPPVIPTTGTAAYTLVGGTSPTDNAGNTGTLGSATFNADFTNQLVNHSINLAFANYSVAASGTASIGSAAGLAPYQFAGGYKSVSFTSAAGGTIAGTGNFSGFFSGPVSALQPLPPGAALMYTLSDPRAGLIVNGVAAFRKP